MRLSPAVLQRATKAIDKYALYVPTKGSFPQGFKVASTPSGVKKNGVLDLGVILNTNKSRASTAAAVFTTNKFKAAPVLLSNKVLEATHGKGVDAIVVNSGCANSVTGDVGLADGKAMLEMVNQNIGKDNATLVMSTGVIGQRLKLDKIQNGINDIFKNNKFGTDFDHWLGLAKSIKST